MRSPLAAAEKRLIQVWVGRFPPWIEGYHLTLLTLVWSAGMLLFGYLAARLTIHFLWASCLMLAAQWFTDSFDGALGRLRDTGIPKWGFHMDHYLDFVFSWCTVVGYAFLMTTPGATWGIFILAFLYSLLMVNSFLGFAATGEFKITYLGAGPTEVRLLFILLNAAIVFWGPGFMQALLPWVIAASVLLVAFVTYRTQKYVWAIDMADKRRRLGR
jgi:phosphatidylglycerophosphate synthase